MDAPAIELRGIEKRFGAVRANRAVSLRVTPGSIHGIVGENGAGKSTLMSILYGFYEADAGEILIAGHPIRIRSPRDAIAAGIGMVHQHFMLVDSFSVIENVLLGNEGGALLAAGTREARGSLARIEAEFQLDVDLDAQVGELPVGLQQRVEILKALHREARVLILDEPTAVLTPQEADRLFAILRSLARRGVTVVLITHKLREILAVTDEVSVMRRGEMVAHRRTADTDRDELAELMVGRKVLLDLERTEAAPGAPALVVDDLVVREGGRARVDGVSFEVHAGEIVGIAGVSGNGQSELLEALAGMRAFHAGSVRVGERELSADRPPDARAMRRLGVAHVPEDRARMGLVRDFQARESALLGYHDDPRYGGVLLDMAAVDRACVQMIETFDVRPADPGLSCGHFSGGNQQKLVLAREIGRGPEVLLVGQPTRGVDIGAIEFIHRQLLALRAGGTAILLVSVELDEIMGLADRILVMFEGRIVGELPREDADERVLGLMMANALDGPRSASAEAGA